MSESKNWQPNILFHSEFINDIENKGNISAFYTLYLTRNGFDNDYSVTIAEEDVNNVINNDNDIENLINNTLFHNFKNNRTTIEQVKSELLNENLIVIDLTKKKDPTFLYENHYWIVFLYRKDEMEKDAYSNGNLKRNYLKTDFTDGSSVLYKIGFIMNIPNNRNIHREVDNVFYLNLDPFTVNCRFDGIEIPDSSKDGYKLKGSIHNNEFNEKYKGVLYNHFHKSSTDSSAYPFKTQFVVNQAKEFGFNVDYFDTPTYDSKIHNNSNRGDVLSIYGEELGLRSETPMSIVYTFFPRNYNENLTHFTNSVDNVLFYDIVESIPFEEKVLFPSEKFNNFSSEDQIELYVDLKRKSGSNIEVELNIKQIKGESFNVFWNFDTDKNSYQKFDTLEENVIKHIYNEDIDYAIIRIEGKISSLDLSDLKLNKCNVRSLALYSNSVVDLGLSDDHKNSSLYKLYLYKCSPLLSNNKLKLRYFSSLIHFEDSKDEKYAFDGWDYNPYFADEYSPVIPNYNKITYNDIKDASYLMSGWKKNGGIEFFASDEIYSFDSIINNSFISSIKIVLNKKSDDINKISSFDSGFKNNLYLSTAILDGFDDIKFESINDLFNGCENLITIRDSNSKENYLVLKNSESTSMDRAFFNTKNLEFLNFKDFDVVSMKDAFNGSGILEIDYSNVNSCQNFSGAFSNCHNLKTLNVNLFNTQDISNLIKGSDNLNVINLIDVRTPISFDRITNDNNSGYKYSIHISPLLNISENGLTIQFNKDYFSNINSPQIKIGDGLSDLVVQEIIKRNNLLVKEDKTQYNILDISQCIKEQQKFIKGKLESVKGWYLYDNYNINNFIYVDFVAKGLRSSYNWNTLVLEENHNSSFIKGGSIDSYVLKNDGEKTDFEIEVVDISHYNENSYDYDYDINTTIKLFEVSRSLGAIDMLFGSSISNNGETPCYLKIRPNKTGYFSVIFMCNSHKNNKSDYKSKITLMLEDDDTVSTLEPISNKIQFIRIENNNYDKINVLKGDSWIKKNFDSFYELDNYNPELVIFNLSSTAVESEAVFKISGKYILNGFIIANSEDILNMLY